LEESIKFAAKEKLEIVLFASASRLRTASVGQARRGGRKGGVGGIPPAEPSQFRSDIFKQTPYRKVRGESFRLRSQHFLSRDRDTLAVKFSVYGVKNRKPDGGPFCFKESLTFFDNLL